jgi:hypothetical protein
MPRSNFDGFQCPVSIINVSTVRLTCAATITRQEDIDHTGIIKFFRRTEPTLVITSNGQHEFTAGYLNPRERKGPSDTQAKCLTQASPYKDYPQSRLLIEKLTSAPLFKIFSVVYETRSFITVFNELCRKATETSPHALTSYLNKMHFNIIPPSTV